MMNDVVIDARQLGKRYWIGSKKREDTLRDTLAGVITSPFRRAAGLARGKGSASETQGKEFWALRDLDLKVKRGESVGIVGRNGAGKSTLLKILSRITEPSRGHVDLTGRVASLLEVGTGFHPDLTGEENIYLNGAILGMSRREVRQRFGQIAEFAGVEKFLRTAVKHYSSGMYTRLAFAVAAHLESETLIVDEVLAVGDQDFQKRCIDRMSGVARSGRTVLFVSHNLAMVNRLCDRAILLEEGRMTGAGEVDAVVKTYLSRSEDQAAGNLADRKDRRGNGALRVTKVVMQSDAHNQTPQASAVQSAEGQHAVFTGQPARIEVSYQHASKAPLVSLRVALTVTDSAGARLFTCSTRFQGGDFATPPPSGVVSCLLPNLALVPGRYRLNVWCGIGGVCADRVDDAVLFDVVPVGLNGTGQVPVAGKHGPIWLDYDWGVLPTQEPTA